MTLTPKRPRKLKWIGEEYPDGRPARYLFGIEHEKLTYLYQGRQFRLTDVGGRVVKEILA